MNRDLSPIPAFAEDAPPRDKEIAAMLARAARVGIPAERVLLALGLDPAADASPPAANWMSSTVGYNPGRQPKP